MNRDNKLRFIFHDLFYPKKTGPQHKSRVSALYIISENRFSSKLPVKQSSIYILLCILKYFLVPATLIHLPLKSGLFPKKSLTELISILVMII